jgi:uncharacterized protein YeeX (DUF496 family)
MSAGLRKIDRDIADVERRISAKNEIIISGLRMGNDTIAEEAQVGEMNRILQTMQGVRRTLVAGLRARALTRGRAWVRGQPQ